MADKSMNIMFYVFGATIIILSSYLVSNYKKTLEPDDEYEMIRKYLQN